MLTAGLKLACWGADSHMDHDCLQDLETHQIHMFYEAVGLMIGAETSPEKREEYLVCSCLLEVCAPAHHLPEVLRIGLTVLLVRSTLESSYFHFHSVTDAADVAAEHHMAADHRTGRPVSRRPEAARGVCDSLTLIHDSCAEIVVTHRKEGDTDEQTKVVNLRILRSCRWCEMFKTYCRPTAAWCPHSGHHSSARCPSSMWTCSTSIGMLDVM